MPNQVKLYGHQLKRFLQSVKFKINEDSSVVEMQEKINILSTVLQESSETINKIINNNELIPQSMIDILVEKKIIKSSGLTPNAAFSKTISTNVKAHLTTMAADEYKGYMEELNK